MIILPKTIMIHIFIKITILFGCVLCISFNTINAQVTDSTAKSDSIPSYQLSEIVVLGERIPDSDPIPAYTLKKRRTAEIGC